MVLLMLIVSIATACTQQHSCTQNSPDGVTAHQEPIVCALYPNVARVSSAISHNLQEALPTANAAPKSDSHCGVCQQQALVLPHRLGPCLRPLLRQQVPPPILLLGIHAWDDRQGGMDARGRRPHCPGVGRPIYHLQAGAGVVAAASSLTWGRHYWAAPLVPLGVRGSSYRCAPVGDTGSGAMPLRQAKPFL